MAASTIRDEEFGEISVRRSRLTRRLTLRIDTRSNVRISLPYLTPIYIAKQFLQENRDFVRDKLTQLQTKRAHFSDGQLIGKTHTLRIIAGQKVASRLHGTDVIVTLPAHILPDSPVAQASVHEAVVKALRKQAESYLSRRISALADTHGFRYNSLRFSNAGTRWGSCSSRGTISLNIWLMQLPFELIDYVLVHELCHTRQMNHSPAFWQHVEVIVPKYREYKRQLKQYHPA